MSLMPQPRRSRLARDLILISFLFLCARAASADPVTTFIVTADSLAKAGGDELLGSYVAENSVIAGAAVAQLLDVGFQVGQAGNREAEEENADFAERVARLYRSETGSEAAMEMVDTFRGWTEEERAVRVRADSLEQAATAARDAGELDRAVDLLEKSLGLYRSIGDRHAQAVLWGSLGVVHWYRGDMEAVKRSYRKALALRREVEDRILEGRTLNGLGSAHFRTGAYDSAGAYYRMAIDLRRRTGALDELGVSLTYLGNTHYMAGRLVAARERFEEALPLLEQYGSPGQRIQVLNSIASLNSDMGRLEEANEAYRRGVRIAETSGEREHEFALHMNLAANLSSMGRFREAVSELKIGEELLAGSEDERKHGELRRRQALTYMQMGEMDRAREYLLEFVQIAEGLDDPLFLTDAMINLGQLYLEVGGYEQGLRVTERGRKLAEEAGNARMKREALAQEARLERQLGKPEEALEKWQEALELARAEDAEEEVLKGELGVAGALAAAGRVEEARSRYRDLSPSVRSSNRDDLRWVLALGLGHTFEEENPDSAAFHYERALQVLEEAREQVGGAEVRTGFLSGQRRYLYEEVARFYATVALEREAPRGRSRGGRDGDWSGRAFHTMERAKARGLLDLLESTVSRKTIPAEGALLDSLYQVDAETPGGAEARRRLEDRYVKMREKRLESALGSLSSVGVADLNEVRKALPRGTVLLEYALGDTCSLLWAVDRRGDDLYLLPDRRGLRERITRLRDAIARPGSGDAVLRATSRDLYRALVEPAAERLEDARHVVIIPDGVLFELPFEVLLEANPGEEEEWSDLSWFGRSFAPVYAPSSSVYLELLKTGRNRGFTGELVALGDPDFSRLEAEPSTPAGTLSPLPHTRRELQNIGSFLEDEDEEIYLGAEASEATLKNALREGSPRILHLATHGLVDPVEPATSCVVLSPDTVSGEDGYLHTLEILSLPIHSGLVVVSACESGLGKVARGEGVVGLSRSLIASGAGGVVVSLWAVSDESTAELMKNFYEAMISERRPAAEALAGARLALLESPKYAHPFFWSPFIVIGTGKTPW
jgi:CHAT domain-containing protein/tetratricopeptide (TPR) repeat protein